ncbi:MULTISPECIES: TetR/AcrR family transcriptional regulator [Streptomyces]|uniref:TetR/AcrR family transcriptional regulator n=1 Tax=Streptomyces sanyensis TaxID=568869 RepID=A0ABP8ZM78_9ACTN
MTRPKRLRLSPEERRAQILDSALALLERRDIEEVSAETVAAEAGVTPGLLFHYFGSQANLRLAVLRALTERLVASVRPDPSLSYAGQLREGLAAFVDQTARHPRAFLAVVRLSTGGGAEVRSLRTEVRRVLADWILTRLVAAGAPETPFLAIGVPAWLSFVEEALVQWLGGSGLSRQELVDLLEESGYRLLGLTVEDPELRSGVLDRIRRAPDGTADPA